MIYSCRGGQCLGQHNRTSARHREYGLLSGSGIGLPMSPDRYRGGHGQVRASIRMRQQGHSS